MVLQDRGARVDTLQKKVVKAVMRDTKNREDRKTAGKSTPFDKAADKAILTAKEQLSLPTNDENIRTLMLDKICKNLYL